MLRVFMVLERHSIPRSVWHACCSPSVSPSELSIVMKVFTTYGSTIQNGNTIQKATGLCSVWQSASWSPERLNLPIMKTVRAGIRRQQGERVGPGRRAVCDE